MKPGTLKIVPVPGPKDTDKLVFSQLVTYNCAVVTGKKKTLINIKQQIVVTFTLFLDL